VKIGRLAGGQYGTVPSVQQKDCLMRIALLAALSLVWLAGPALADGSTAAIDPAAVNNVDNLALKGFDPVAYFTDSKALKGDPKITSQFQKVTYEFVSAEHKALFEKNPTHYIPSYNGFCASGVSNGLKLDIDPHAYAINAGVLDLFFSEETRDSYEADLAQRSQLAKKNWPAVQKLAVIIR
jgi:hypothetical protein